MPVATLIVLSQGVLAACFGLSVFYGVKKLSNYSQQPDVQRAKSKMSAWPKPFPWFAQVIAPFLLFTQRFVRPSSSVRRDLGLVGTSLDFDDLEFIKMRFVLACVGFLCGLLVFVLTAVFKPSDVSYSQLVFPIFLCLGGYFLPRISLRDRSLAVLRRVQKNFPSFLDVFALTLESGQNFQSALMMSVQHLAEPSRQPGLRTQLQEVLRSIRAGQSRMQALQQMSDRLTLPEVVQFVASVAASEKQGVSVTTLFRRQSEQLRTSRALAAERHAMKLPVKLLAPLAICIFPCTFLVLAFPIGMQLLSSGLV